MNLRIFCILLGILVYSMASLGNAFADTESGGWTQLDQRIKSNQADAINAPVLIKAIESSAILPKNTAISVKLNGEQVQVRLIGQALKPADKTYIRLRSLRIAKIVLVFAKGDPALKKSENCLVTWKTNKNAGQVSSVKVHYYDVAYVDDGADPFRIASHLEVNASSGLAAHPHDFASTPESTGDDVMRASMSSPQLIYIYGDWCAPCTKMREIFGEVVSTSSTKAHFVKINFDNSEKPENKTFFSKYSIEFVPCWLAISRKQLLRKGWGQCSKSTLLGFANGSIKQFGKSEAEINKQIREQQTVQKNADWAAPLQKFIKLSDAEKNAWSHSATDAQLKSVYDGATKALAEGCSGGDCEPYMEAVSTIGSEMGRRESSRSR